MPQTLSAEVPYEELEESPLPETTAQFEEIPPAEPAPTVVEDSDEAEKEDALDDPLVVVIRSAPAAEPVGPIALAAASRRERERRSEVRSVEVINDENLAEKAKGGQITIANTPPATAEDVAAAAQVDEQTLEEEYWRSNALQLRLAWKEAVEDVARLEQDVAGLRRRFYAEDDGFYRDNEIKPAWDRSLEELALARTRAGDSATRLDLLLEEGRQAGALPGWLREGREYEPVERRPGPERQRDDPREPKIVEEDRDP